MVSSLASAAWLNWVPHSGETVSRTARETLFPRSLYCCLLDEQPDHLVPARLRERERISPQRLVLNPGFRHGCEGTPPDIEINSLDRAGCFAPFESAIWLDDPANGIVLPFWVSPQLRYVLSLLYPNDACPGTIPTEARAILAAAGILVEPDTISQRRSQRDKYLSYCAAQFGKDGFVPLRNLIHPFHISALRQYFRRQIRTGKLGLGDSQTPRRFVSHNHPVARLFHLGLTNVVSTLVGKAVKPSYVYLASYQDGAALDKHIDREQCEFSITFCLDYSPEPVRETPWPLHLETPHADITILQCIGDALLYRGRVIPHFRRPIPPGHTSTSIFFHYVATDFAGNLY